MYSYLCFLCTFQFKGTIDFTFDRNDILAQVRQTFPGTIDLYGFECIFNVSAKDWFFNITQTGFASTVIFDPRIKLVFIGDYVRTFKPDSTMTVYVSVVDFSIIMINLILNYNILISNTICQNFDYQFWSFPSSQTMLRNWDGLYRKWVVESELWITRNYPAKINIT